MTEEEQKRYILSQLSHLDLLRVLKKSNHPQYEEISKKTIAKLLKDARQGK